MSKIIVGGASAVIYKSGTALVAQLPDNAIAGGNARGVNAVDLQTVRNSNTQVSSGAGAVIAGGEFKTGSGAQSGALSGWGNIASGNAAVISGGGGNQSSALYATIAGGFSNITNGTGSWVPGGLYASTRGIYGRGAWAAQRILASGDAQCGEHPLLRQTTDATATRLTGDNAAPGTTNQIILPNFSSYSGLLIVTAKAAGSTAAASWTFHVSAVRGNGVGTVVVYQGGGSTIAPTASNGTGSTWRLDVTADTTNGGIAVTVTGAAATTIHWSARFANVEVVTAS